MHVLTIHGWIPARLNALIGNRRKAGRLKRADRQRVAVEAMFQAIPKATGRRRVTIEITFGKGVRSGDPDAYFKSTLDALVHAGLLVGDTIRGVEIATPVFRRGEKSLTVIRLEDVPELSGSRAKRKREAGA